MFVANSLKKSNQRFGEFKFEYFGGSDVANQSLVLSKNFLTLVFSFLFLPFFPFLFKSFLLELIEKCFFKSIFAILIIAAKIRFNCVYDFRNHLYDFICFRSC